MKKAVATAVGFTDDQRDGSFPAASGLAPRVDGGAIDPHTGLV
jgi:hypothetical protein